jgi:hypothetical protein
MKEELLSGWAATHNHLFLLFLLCFFTSAALVGNNRFLLTAITTRLFRKQDRQSIFAETVHNEFVSQIILCLQTVLMASFIAYCGLSRHLLPFESLGRFGYEFGGTIAIVLLFTLYKFASNLLLGYIFFPPEDSLLWNTCYLSIIAFSGIILFPPAILIFYVPKAQSLCLCFSLIYLLFIKSLSFYKIFTIFFSQKSAPLHFILYLCSQELLPLFFIWKALVYFYKT